MVRVLKNGTEISPAAVLVASPVGRQIGLMFSRPRDLVFDLGRERRVWLHMFFVFFPIDVVLLDSRREVVGLREGLRPFRLYTPGVSARYILELRKGTIARGRVRPGDRLDLA